MAETLYGLGQELRPYEPTWRDRAALWLLGNSLSGERQNFVSGLVGSRGLGNTGMSLADLTPPGAVMGFQEAAQHGDKTGMALNAMAMVPGSVAGKVAMAAVDAAKPAAKAVAKAVDDGLPGILAYHGSPHSFDKFDLSKIGTGEGAQAYGHGLYFAEKEGVAKGYRDALAKDQYYSPTGEMFDPQSQLQHLNVRVAARNNGPDLDATIARAQELLPKASEQTRPMLENDIAVLQRFKDAGGVSKNPGHMYEVRINADPAHFLDWDKPLSEQGPAAQAAWDKFVNSKIGMLADKSNHGAIVGGEGQFANPTGKELYQALAEGLIGYGKPRPYAQVTGEASQRLQKQGIPGIKYLDAGSRGAGEGSRNYVVFDDKTIEILKKYGLPIPVAGAAFDGLDQYAQPSP